jgi:four helix bundle protein
MEKKYLKLNDIDAYKRAFHLSNLVWEEVTNWDTFPKNTIGSQFVRAVDSISANLAEGFGRYSKKDKIKFYRIAVGSLKESFDWNEKARYRNLISSETYSDIFNKLNILPLEINQLIKYTDLTLKK